MKLLKFTLIPLACLLSYFAHAQGNTYARIGFENTTSHTFTVRTPSSLQFQPRERRWLTVKVGEEVKYIKMMKKHSLFVVTPEMNNTIIDISGTAKMRNKGDTEIIIYLQPPQDQVLPSSKSENEVPAPEQTDVYYDDSDSWKHYEQGIITRGSYGTVNRHPDLPNIIAEHKKVAIVPINVTITDRKMTKNKRNTPEAIAKKEKQFQTNFQRSFYERLVRMRERDKLWVDVQDVATTNQLLTENGLENMEDLLGQEHSQIADILGVDAVFSADVDILQMMSKGGALILGTLGNAPVSTDRSKVALSLYDGYTGAHIWGVWKQFDNDTPFWQTEGLIQSMLKGEIDKHFPYHVGYIRPRQQEVTTSTPVEEEATPPPPPEIEGETDYSGEVLTLAQEMPRFPGCENMGLTSNERKKCSEKKQLEYIYKNIKYPTIARENGIEGVAVISFIVEKDGSVTNAKVEKDVGGGCGAEALRLIEAMPRWIPGKQSNEPVRVRFGNLPVRFKLEG